ncbi:hypothetical protein CC80DRAFT_581040 [Byssothecium circinans]|uniref:Uncharacterized protein n=1 Tax=Byssothecium circinans TaxID=147558 RepID=A0A6A5U7C7_9PLEO|nr:hypothetical protein CC80DRAFT_581040 [Byssothecium circinans]
MSAQYTVTLISSTQHVCLTLSSHEQDTSFSISFSRKNVQPNRCEELDTYENISILQDSAKCEGIQSPTFKEGMEIVKLVESTRKVVNRAMLMHGEALQYYVTVARCGVVFEATVSVADVEGPLARAKGKSHTDAVYNLGKALQRMKIAASWVTA